MCELQKKLGPVHQPPKAKKASAPRGRGYGRRNPSQKDMDAWRAEARDQVPTELADSDIPVAMHIDAYFRRPQGHYNRRGSLTRDAPRFHTQTPDTDNIIKFIGDALKGLAYRDDRFVYGVSGMKRWTKGESRTAVTLKYEMSTHK